MEHTSVRGCTYLFKSCFRGYHRTLKFTKQDTHRKMKNEWNFSLSSSTKQKTNLQKMVFSLSSRILDVFLARFLRENGENSPILARTSLHHCYSRTIFSLDNFEISLRKRRAIRNSIVEKFVNGEESSLFTCK